ncbi:MAG: hypothetical protein KJS92_09095 [Bacteroidetes bacterium]|nr:hypothetical protein [Bacteroidota bacterium]
MNKGALLLKGESGWVTRLYPFIATAFMLWLIGAIVQNMIPENYAVYWDYILIAVVLLIMYVGTRNWVNHRLYEHGLELLHPLTGRKEFRAFHSMLRLETHRNNISTRYNRANYIDILCLYFEDGTEWELSSMELDNFHEFRNLCLQQYELYRTE